MTTEMPDRPLRERLGLPPDGWWRRPSSRDRLAVEIEAHDRTKALFSDARRELSDARRALVDADAANIRLRAALDLCYEDRDAWRLRADHLQRQLDVLLDPGPEEDVQRQIHVLADPGPADAAVAPMPPPRPAPGLAPAPPITLPPGEAPYCSLCGAPMAFGVRHYCRQGVDYRPQRTVA